VPQPGWQPEPSWGPPPQGWQLWVEDAPAARRTRPDQHRSALQQVAAGVVGSIVLLFTIVGLASGGVGGGLIMLGVAGLLVGLGAAAFGRARWAFIASRKVGAAVAAIGLVTLVVGSATAPDPAPVSAAADTELEVRAPSPSPTVDEEAASAAADAAAAAEEVDEQVVPVDALAATGLLSDGDAAGAITQASRTSALAALAAVEVKGRAPRTGYSRDLFGSGWVDTDRNGCDTRNDVLARDLTAETFKPGTRDCVVLTGALADPYTPRAITFQRGQDTSSDVQIDHVVALSDAWQKGAQGWDGAKRTAFANDPLNLLAVDGPLNAAKGDGDAATWLPPNKAYRCAYVARQVAVKVSYGLWMTQAEKNASATVLAACPDEPLPGGVVASIPEPAPTKSAAPAPAAPRAAAPAPAPAAPAPAPAPVPAPAPAPAGVTYANCSEVQAAGAAPIRPGDPGWQDKFDGDGDGQACGDD